MTRLRVIGAAVLAIAVAAVALPAHANDDGGDSTVSFDSILTDESCGEAAMASGPDQCHAQATASPSRGAVSAESGLVSPENGRAPWKAKAGTRSQLVATYTLDEPVAELNFEIKMRIQDAQVSLASSGLPLIDPYLGYQLGNSGYVTVNARASHSNCPDYCGGGTSLMQLYTDDPGTTVRISGQDVVVPLRVSRRGGLDLPPGEVTVETGVFALVDHDHSWGDDSASIDAVIQGITAR